MFDKRKNIKDEPPHDFLVTAGCWLLDNRRLRCVGHLVTSSGGHYNTETPRMWVITPELHTWGSISDVIGFNIFGVSVCLECKTSRSDFLRDKHKPNRSAGNVFYYLTFPGIVNLEKDSELLKDAGVIEYNDGRFEFIKFAEWRDTDGKQEMMVLMRLLDYNNVLGIKDYRGKGNIRYQDKG